MDAVMAGSGEIVNNIVIPLASRLINNTQKLRGDMIREPHAVDGAEEYEAARIHRRAVDGENDGAAVTLADCERGGDVMRQVDVVAFHLEQTEREDLSGVLGSGAVIQNGWRLD